MINRGLFLLFLMAVGAQIQSMEIEVVGDDGVGLGIGFQSKALSDCQAGVAAQQIVDTFSGGELGDYKPVLELLEGELSNNPAISTQLSQRSGGEEGANKRLRLMGGVLVQVLKKTNEEKNKNTQEVNHQKDKVRVKKEQLQSEEKKSFWSILAAVGSAVLAVASTAWAGVETATGSETVPVVCNYVVDVICNCTSAIY